MTRPTRRDPHRVHVRTGASLVGIATCVPEGRAKVAQRFNAGMMPWVFRG